MNCPVCGSSRYKHVPTILERDGPCGISAHYECPDCRFWGDIPPFPGQRERHIQFIRRALAGERQTVAAWKRVLAENPEDDIEEDRP